MSESIIDAGTFDTLVATIGADFIGELLDAFFEESPVLIDGLAQALSADDADAFRRAAHSLKSNAATFGARALSQQSEALERLGRDDDLASVQGGLQALSQEWTRAMDALERRRHDYP